MPEATAALAQAIVDLIIQAGKPSRGSIAMLMAAAAKPAGQMNIGQVSPTRKRQRLPEEIDEGNDHRGRQQDRDRLAAAIAAPRRQATPDSTTGSRMNPTSPNCRPMKSPTVRNDISWVAAARTNWNRNDAQSCSAFQIRTGENTASAISAAAHG